jgi:hypothetical protein
MEGKTAMTQTAKFISPRQSGKTWAQEMFEGETPQYKWFSISKAEWPRTTTRSQYKAVTSWLRKAENFLRKSLMESKK